jgi:hypothetical protein
MKLLSSVLASAAIAVFFIPLAAQNGESGSKARTILTSAHRGEHLKHPEKLSTRHPGRH